MAMPSSPVSDLSALNSDDFDEEVHQSRSENDQSINDDNESSVAMPPSKRRRVARSRRSPNLDGAAGNPPPDVHAEEAAYDTDVSSDGFSNPDVPLSVWRDIGIPADEWEINEEQVRVCIWEGCDAGDLGDQDELVKHINEVHIADAKSRYFVCEWGDCRAKGKPQMSAYALRAHLRSHTKEKPFFCTLPECDRSFTRSDALAKHMRTVHETEASTTSNFYQIKMRAQVASETNQPMKEKAEDGTGADSTKAEGAASKPTPRLKLVLNKDKPSAPATPQQNGTDSTDSDHGTGAPPTPLSPSTRDSLFGAFPESLQFTKEEAAMPRRDLFRLLRRQLHWAQQESEALQERISELESQRQEEWLAKELVLENVMESELASAVKRGVLDDDGEDGAFGEGQGNDWADRPLTAEDKAAAWALLEKDAKVSSNLPLDGPDNSGTPWYRGRGFEFIRKVKMHEEADELDSAHASDPGKGEDIGGEGGSSDVHSENAVKVVPKKVKGKRTLKKKPAPAAPAVTAAADGDETEEGQ